MGAGWSGNSTPFMAGIRRTRLMSLLGPIATASGGDFRFRPGGLHTGPRGTIGHASPSPDPRRPPPASLTMAIRALFAAAHMLLVYFQRGRQDDEPFRHPAFGHSI
jgi:hypothetical protein